MGKKSSLILILIIILIVFGFFYWWNSRETKGSPEDYIIKETAEGTIVENKRAGLIVEAPEGWETQKIELGEGSIITKTKDIEGILRNGIINPPLKKGCIIETTTIYKEMDFKEIEEEVKNIHLGLGIKSEEFGEITINNRVALKNTFDSLSSGPGSVIYFLNEDKVYSFDISWAPEEKEKCIQSFDNFLKNISIE